MFPNDNPHRTDNSSNIPIQENNEAVDALRDILNRLVVSNYMDWATFGATSKDIEKWKRIVSEHS